MKQTADERHDMLERYANGARLLHEVWDRVPDEARHWRPAPGKWSAHEVICHCADSEMNAAARIRYLLCEKEPVILGYDQDCWSRVLDYEHHPVEPAFAVVDAVRANTTAMLAHLEDSIWERQGRHTDSGEFSAEDWLRIYAGHLEVHTRQIERNLEQWELATSH